MELNQLQDRAQYIAGLRILADELEANDDLVLPTHTDTKWLLFGNAVARSEQRTHAQRIVRELLPISGEFKKWNTGDLFRFSSTLGGPKGLHIEVIVDREEVCERVVTGTREVTRTVPDPDVVATAPLVEITEEVEDVEWRCGSLLEERK